LGRLAAAQKRRKSKTLKSELERLISEALKSLVGPVLPQAADPSSISVERSRDAGHGDFTSNIAMRLAKQARRPPRDLARSIVAALPANPAIARMEVAGAGFINFYLAAGAQNVVLHQIFERGDRFGESNVANGESLIIEFVSANPTGPLHVGHGRQAAYGATLANLLHAIGHRVHREFYINDGGRQMDILTVSTWLRYLEHCGESLPFPSNGYRGDYVRAIAAQLFQRRGRELVRPADEVLANLPPDAPVGDKEQHIDALIGRMTTLVGDSARGEMHEMALALMLTDMRQDLRDFGVEFDTWASERELARNGAIEHAIEVLQAKGALYPRDGAVWFRAIQYGDHEDRVLV
jgi:arginyl-tRNA synthetase